MTAKASNILDEDFEENEEPSVLSKNPNERKLARHIRIQRRIEASQKVNETDGEDVVEESLTEKHILESKDRLEKLIAEGNEVISNVRVANDARELERRKQASETREKLLKRVEESTAECKREHDTINAKWPSILHSNDPLDINSEMLLQQEKCNQVLAKKDAVIAELKDELQKADEQYFDDQKKQKDDIKFLTERIENQMGTLENVYSRELKLIQETLKTERDALVNSFQKKWDALYKQLEDEDSLGDEKINEIMKEYEDKMEAVMTEHDEEYRAQKIQLETECQNLQQEVERTKAVCLLNSEKLSYNYTLLKSREEENAIIKSQQKRKINKLQSLINQQKKNYSDLQENTKLEMEKLTKQILKYHKSIAELEEKSIHFSRVNEKQYLDIWDMNTENANQLVEKILATDKIIHERILGILWEPPQKALPKKEDLPSYRKIMSIIQKRKQEEVERLKLFEYKKEIKSCPDTILERELLSKVLKQISNSSGYLIEDKLQEIITCYSEEEKTIIRLDNIFQALSISTVEEINMLLEFFLPYAYCPVCSTKEDSFSSDSLSEQISISNKSLTGVEVYDSCKDENVKKLLDSVKDEIRTDSLSSNKLDKINYLKSDSFVSESVSTEDGHSSSNDRELKVQSKRFTCDKGHVLEIQAALVTKAMKEFITKLSAAEQKEILSFEERLKEKKHTIVRNLSAEDVKAYWSTYREIIGPEKEKLWDTILMGLNKYYEVLKERHKLYGETENLKKQNAELRRLLETQIINPEDGLTLLQIKSAKNSANK